MKAAASEYSVSKYPVDFETTLKLVDFKIHEVFSSSTVPVLDRFSLCFLVSPAYQFGDSEELKALLVNNGARVSHTHRKKKRTADIDVRHVLQRLENGAFQLQLWAEGNGHKILESHGYALGHDLDGHRNVLRDVSFYGRKDLLLKQIATILSVIVDRLSTTLSITRSCLPVGGIDMKLPVIELAYHIQKPACLIDQHSNDLLESSRSLYEKVQVLQVKENGAIKSFAALVDQDLQLKIYQKLGEIIRVEHVFSGGFLRQPFGKPETVGELVTYFEERLVRSRSHLMNLLRYEPSIKQLNALEAMSALHKGCSKRAFEDILRRLREGDGQMRVLSSEGLIYRNLSKLIDAGVIAKGIRRSEYRLLPEYRSLLSQESVLDRFLIQSQHGGRLSPNQGNTLAPQHSEPSPRHPLPLNGEAEGGPKL